MNKELITKINKEIRNSRPVLTDENICSVFSEGDLIEIGFLSKCCKNNHLGSCIMCDYGMMPHRAENNKYIREMLRILEKYSVNKKYLLICSNGSILDEYQIPTELLKEILYVSQCSPIPHIIIETHFKDVTQQRLNLIKNIIRKPVDIEMGLETISSKYQDAFFIKGIDLILYEKTLNMIKDYGYKAELNIMFGLPFLSTKEQISDVQKTVKWTVEHDCIPIIFPINIKPHTMLRYIYDKNLYKPVSLWALVYLLDNLDMDSLGCVLIAWYGNRDESYVGDTPTVFPNSCNKCKNNLAKFFRNFLDTDSCYKRKELIKQLISDAECDCYQNVVRDLSCSDDLFDNNYEAFCQLLKDDYNTV